jgi:hypothetical protein
MGLDIYFSVPEGEDPFLSLRNHDYFFALMCNPEPEPYRPQHSDFMVTRDMLDRMQARIMAHCEAEGVTPHMLFETLPHDFEDWDARGMAWRELLPCYLCIVKDFRVWVNEHRFIICSWSA